MDDAADPCRAGAERGDRAGSGPLPSALLSFSEGLLCATDPERVAGLAVEAASRLLGGAHAALILRSRGGFWLAAARGWAEGREPGSSPSLEPLARQAGMQSVASCPVRGAEGEPLGRLEVYAAPANAFDERAWQHLQVLADLTGVGLHRADLHQEARDQIALWKRLWRAGWKVSVTRDRATMYVLIGEHAKALVGADGAAVYRVRPDGVAECPWSSGVSRAYVDAVVAHAREVPGWQAYERGEVIILQDVGALERGSRLRELALAEGIASIALFPMWFEGRPVGLLALYHRTPRTYRLWEQEAVGAFAQHAALALAGAALLEEVQGRAEELEGMYRQLQAAYRQLQALQEIGQEVASSLDLGQVLQTIARHSAELTGSDAAGVFEYDPRTDVLAISTCYRASAAFVDAVTRAAVRPGQGAIGRAARELRPVEVQDTQSEPGYPFRAIAAIDGYRSVLAVPMVAPDGLVGGLVVWRRRPGPFDEETVRLLSSLAHHSTAAVRNARLYRALEQAYDATLDALTAALDVRDRDTEGHSRRVTELALAIAREMELSRVELQALFRGGLLHDIGKIGIPDAILHKPGPLSEDEWRVMREHPRLGYQVLSGVDFLAPAMAVVLHHHERYDGRGYPQGLKGEDIPLVARVFAVADAYDAMTSARPYRSPMPPDEAVEEIRRGSGAQFDPRVVQAFLRVLESGWHPSAPACNGSTR